MEKTWEINGAFADWRLTVAFVPATGERCGNLPESSLESLAEHFRTVVEMVEAHRELDHLTPTPNSRTSG